MSVGVFQSGGSKVIVIRRAIEIKFGGKKKFFHIYRSGDAFSLLGEEKKWTLSADSL